MKVAGIDCGTNSIRLLIADIEPGRPLRDLERTMQIVRLGQGVDRTGRFAEDALERTFASAEYYAELCRQHEVEDIRFVATSATRDAENRDVFITGIEQRLGVTPQVISGQREAQLSFAGATSVIDATDPVAVVDLGGGSTEIVVGTAAEGVTGSYSMNIGCVRMQERHFTADPPTPEQIESARRDIRAALDQALERVDISRATNVVGLAGTVTTLTARALGLSTYDPAAIDGARLTLDQVYEACDWLMTAGRDERAAEGYMHPGRIDVIAAGALVWSEVVRRCAEEMPGLTSVTASEHDILDGIALWAAGLIA
ncbi:Ppx/GppA family phosphatase [Flaviflexus salsibiostraticola]|uniref:Ppx/GppA family phosphatase n=1 Tax=Flaviflexus salsibiostraticola TaxID=1282737 RepID=A0A3Q8WUX5_9ACTO|nr:Ppx/GppA phosphatase family protein [Flaviflexus salsibiostraticola]AZN30686.1 Ppx/GppA family phosphatase [Flaviflexus salsibiostraticola]